MRRVVLQYAMVPTHRASFRGSFPALDEAAAAWLRGDRRARPAAEERMTAAFDVRRLAVELAAGDIASR